MVFSKNTLFFRNLHLYNFFAIFFTKICSRRLGAEIGAVLRRFADTLVVYLIVIIVGLKSAILGTDGEVNPSECKFK